MKINTSSLISKYSKLRKYTTGNSVEDIKNGNMKEYFEKNKYKLGLAIIFSAFFAWKLTLFLIFVVIIGIVCSWALPKNKD